MSEALPGAPAAATAGRCASRRLLAEPAEAQACNCSICAKTGFIHLIVPESRFRLLAGEDRLTAYTFNTGMARHLFCAVCGVKSFYRPRSNPDGWSVNARCLDEPLDLDAERLRRPRLGSARRRPRPSFRGGRMTDILMPALSPTMEEGTLAKWQVKAGDTVKSGDVIAEIETDKATMEVEAVDEGVVDALLVPEGTEGVKVNAPIARLLGEGEARPSPAPAPPPAPTMPAAPRPGRSPRLQPLLVQSRPRPRRWQARAQRRRTRRWSGSRASSPRPWRGGSPAEGRGPLDVKGSGPHGRIIRRDIDGAEAKPAAAPAAAQPAAAVAPSAPREFTSLEQMGIPRRLLRPRPARRHAQDHRAADDRQLPRRAALPADHRPGDRRLLAARGKINAMLEATA